MQYMCVTIHSTLSIKALLIHCGAFQKRIETLEEKESRAMLVAL